MIDERGSVADAAMPNDVSARTVEPYDFDRPATLAREHVRPIELAFETFARQWATQLTDKVRIRAQVGFEHVSMLTYAEYADALPAMTTIVVCAVPGTEQRAIVQFPLSAALSWVVQLVGGKPVEVTEERPLTPIEQALIRHVMTDVLEHLAHALGRLFPRGLTVAAIQYSPQFAQLAGPGDPVIAARFTLTVGDRRAPASVMLPAGPVVDRLTSDSPAEPADLAPGRIRRQVEDTPIELALRLAPRPVRPADVLGLSVGDLIRLPHAHDRPLELVAGHVPVATAAVGASGARLACVITSTPASPGAPESVSEEPT